MAAELDGTTDFYSLTAPVVNVPLSLSFLVNADVITGTKVAVVLERTSPEHYIRVGFKNSAWGARANDGTSTNLSIGGPSVDTWYHMGYTEASGGNSRILYANGSATSPETTAKTYSDFVTMRIGHLFATSNYLDGGVAEVAAWNTELSTNHMAMLNARYSPLLVEPASLVFYVSLVRGVFDYINGATITPSGTPTVDVHPRVLRPVPQVISYPIVAAPGGLPIPVAMNSYRKRRVYA